MASILRTPAMRYIERSLKLSAFLLSITASLLGWQLVHRARATTLEPPRLSLPDSRKAPSLSSSPAGNSDPTGTTTGDIPSSPDSPVATQTASTGSVRNLLESRRFLLSQAASLSDKISDPLYNQCVREETAKVFDRTHAEVFRELGLSDEQLDALRGLLADRLLDTFEASAISASNLDDIRAVRDGSLLDVDGKIRKLLGNDKYQRFVEYEETLPFRAQLREITSALAGTANELRPEQVNAYISAVRQDWANRPALQQELLRLGRLLPVAPAPLDSRTLVIAEQTLNPAQYEALLTQRARTRVTSLVNPRALYEVALRIRKSERK